MEIRIRTPAATIAIVAANAAALVTAQSAVAAHVRAPTRLHPGSVVYVQISDYPPGSRVRVQLATRRSLHSNCCVSLTYPRVHTPGILVNRNGSATIRWHVPTQYAQCVSSICSSPDDKRFKYREPVLVDVSTTDDTAFADSPAHIT
ncbi:MAG TPA: hypothetical protein VGL57_01180 [Solirubrobacteraceae bacterium]|jgi:hypothetical protein